MDRRFWYRASVTPEQAERLEAEALRIYRRYQKEVVEALSLCPWAEKADADGNVRIAITLDDASEAVDAFVEELAGDEQVHVGLIVMPLSERGRKDHERFVAQVRERHAAAHGGSPPMAMAAFHFDAQANLETPARLVPFIRRSPDPTIQLVRLSVLEELRAPFETGTGYVDLSRQSIMELLASPPKKPLHERIAQHNHETISSIGAEAFAEKVEAIRRDRDASYARILGYGAGDEEQVE